MDTVGLEFWLFLGGATVVVLLLAWLLPDTSRKRVEALRAEAPKLGMRFFEHCDDSAFSHTHRFVFVERTRGRWSNVLVADDGDRTLIGEYRWTYRSGKSHRVTQQTMALLSGGRFPDFALEAEDLLHKLGQLVGYQDIDFPDHPAFSKACLLRGKDERAVRASFRRELRDWVLDHPDWRVEANSGVLAVWKPAQLTPPAELAGLLAEARQVFEWLQR